ncbi:MAG: LysM peptidoglycan-binding domain-containing protein [Acidobacteria bacterium]|nr:LysM peptidoglycan-binding domain-containing protein [Acidobacteriota bacterium]
MRSWAKIAGGLLVGVLIVGAESALSQSLGDLVRQEQARRAAEPSPAAHVYTNEDLQRPKILNRKEPADSKSLPPATTLLPVGGPVETAKLPGVVRWSPETPLGDIARYYRQRKQLLQEQNVVKEAKQTEKPSQPPFRNSSAPSVAVSANLLGSKRREKVQQAESPNIVPLPAEERIRVESGDSLWKLASRYLGDGAKWRKFVEANPELSDPNRIRAGQQLRLPSSVAAPEFQQVRVQSGDSLWKLAQARFGDGEAWGCIVAVNPQIDDANRIYPCQLLTVPARCSSPI